MEAIQLVGDGVAICMCVVTVIFLAKERFRSRSDTLAPAVVRIMGDFSHELRRFVKGNRETLNDNYRPGSVEFRTAGYEGNNDSAEVGTGSKRIRGVGHETENGCDFSGTTPGDRYEEVKRLADMGFDKEAIFERVGLPRGEIELVLKVNRLRLEAGKNATSANPAAI